MIIENSKIGYLHEKNPEKSAFGQGFPWRMGSQKIFKSDTFTYTLSHFTRWAARG
jgi:hypothetical protein